jgi:hypothetical protein
MEIKINLIKYKKMKIKFSQIKTDILYIVSKLKIINYYKIYKKEFDLLIIIIYN